MMPTYDYKCQTCGITVEVSHAISDHGPRCDCGEVMQKVFTVVPAIFKGEGWGGQK